MVSQMRMDSAPSVGRADGWQAWMGIDTRFFVDNTVSPHEEPPCLALLPEEPPPRQALVTKGDRLPAG